MYRNKIPKTSICRLAIYLRGLERLSGQGRVYISSYEIGKLLGIDSTQVRKDLSYFGQFGRVGKGYHIRSLTSNLKKILKLYRKTWKVALAGVGNLGSALLSYKGFREVGFNIIAAFDKNPKKVGKIISGVKIYFAHKMKEIIKKENIKIGIIAVPSESAQQIAKIMVDSGIKSILNFAPIRLDLPSGVVIRNVDLSIELLCLPYYISHD